MTSKQESKLNMYNAVLSFSAANTTIIATIPAYPIVVTAFTNKTQAIDAMAQLEATVISGITINKADLKKALCQTGANTAAAGYAYATFINDPILKEKFNYSYSDLFRLKDDELTIIVQNLHNDASDIVTELEPYGVTAATLTAFQTEIGNYNTSVPSPRNAAAQRKAYKEQLKTLFKEADKLLKEQMDKLAQQYKTTNTEFYNTYKNNRKIIDAPTSSTQATGTITDSITTNPIFEVTITVAAEDYTTTTDINGRFTLKIPVPGVYTLIFTKLGYQTHQQPNITITLGQTTTLDIQLVPAT
jgi:hypothetical protein